MIRTRHMAVLFACALVACTTAASWGQAEQGKSAEEILNRLLGGERGIQGVVRDQPSGEDGQPRVAVPIHFDYNSAEIVPDSFEQLHQVAQALQDAQLSSARIRVEGHTDNRGSASYNQQLSERRAQAVKRYLAEKEGIPVARLEARGYGMSRSLPGVSQDTDAGRAQNRRVEFVNLGSGQARAADQKSSAAAAPKLSVKVSVNYQHSGERRELAPGGVLTPNDNYRVRFTPNRGGYVYVYQIDSKGKAEIVFPNSQYSTASNPVQAKRAYDVPPEGQWLTLDQVPGEEEIVVLAAETELADAQSMAIKMRRAEFGTTMRGPAANARTDVSPELPGGVFSYRLPFKHR